MLLLLLLLLFVMLDITRPLKISRSFLVGSMEEEEDDDDDDGLLFI